MVYERVPTTSPLLPLASSREEAELHLRLSGHKRPLKETISYQQWRQ